ncbi:MAG: hypothetical protein H0X67_14815 [Acidobacteria bacterium]|nr:hypothetical protein [Acidobacteriota bacterium]
MKLNVHGPEGAWRLVSARGAAVEPRQGRTGDVLIVTPAAGRVIDYDIPSNIGARSSPRRAAPTPDRLPVAGSSGILPSW